MPKNRVIDIPNDVIIKIVAYLTFYDLENLYQFSYFRDALQQLIDQSFGKNGFKPLDNHRLFCLFHKSSHYEFGYAIKQDEKMHHYRKGVQRVKFHNFLRTPWFVSNSFWKLLTPLYQINFFQRYVQAHIIPNGYINSRNTFRAVHDISQQCDVAISSKNGVMNLEEGKKKKKRAQFEGISYIASRHRSKGWPYFIQRYDGQNIRVCQINAKNEVIIRKKIKEFLLSKYKDKAIHFRKTKLLGWHGSDYFHRLCDPNQEERKREEIFFRLPKLFLKLVPEFAVNLITANADTNLFFEEAPFKWSVCTGKEFEYNVVIMKCMQRSSVKYRGLYIYTLCVDRQGNFRTQCSPGHLFSTNSELDLTGTTDLSQFEKLPFGPFEFSGVSSKDFFEEVQTVVVPQI
mmetsp:Transcript_423/g.776  ORF Transcript_423/g.776 Transcript_423/m.776 type:complete len:401 (-) Transcript_423:1950-3152(-)